MNLVTVEFTNSSVSTYLGEVIQDPDGGIIIIHNEQEDLNISINWAHVYSCQVEKAEEE